MLNPTGGFTKCDLPYTAVIYVLSFFWALGYHRVFEKYLSAEIQQFAYSLRGRYVHEILLLPGRTPH